MIDREKMKIILSEIKEILNTEYGSTQGQYNKIKNLFEDKYDIVKHSPLINLNEAVYKIINKSGCSKERALDIVLACEALGLIKFALPIEIVDSPRPVDRDDLKRDFNIYLADLETAIKGFKDCIREL